MTNRLPKDYAKPASNHPFDTKLLRQELESLAEGMTKVIEMAKRENLAPAVSVVARKDGQANIMEFERVISAPLGSGWEKDRYRSMQALGALWLAQYSELEPLIVSTVSECWMAKRELNEQFKDPKEGVMPSEDPDRTEAFVIGMVTSDGRSMMAVAPLVRNADKTIQPGKWEYHEDGVDSNLSNEFFRAYKKFKAEGLPEGMQIIKRSKGKESNS